MSSIDAVMVSNLTGLLFMVLVLLIGVFGWALIRPAFRRYMRRWRRR